MSRTVVVANPSHSFSEVLELFSKLDMHHLPVVDGDGKVIGIISSNDLMKIFNNPKHQGMTINSAEIDKELNITELMTPDPITVTSKETVKHAAKLCFDNKIHSLPVVDEGKLVGIVTLRDLAQLVAYFA